MIIEHLQLNGISLSILHVVYLSQNVNVLSIISVVYVDKEIIMLIPQIFNLLISPFISL